jgi:hypothetical protein
MAERKNYNTAALMGADITDLEVCEDLKLNPNLAFTPEINIAALKVVRQRNIDDAMKSGMTENAAVKNANQEFNKAKSLNEALLKRA